MVSTPVGLHPTAAFSTDEEQQRIVDALRYLRARGELREQDVYQVRSAVTAFASRTGRKLTKSQYAVCIGVLSLAVRYKLEFGRCLLRSWDSAHVVRTAAFERVRVQMENLIPEAQAREDSAMLQAAAERQSYIGAADGHRYRFSRASIVAGLEASRRKIEAFKRLENSVADLLRRTPDAISQ